MTTNIAHYPVPPRADADDAMYEAIRDAFHKARFYDREVCEYIGVEDLAALFRLGESPIKPSQQTEHAISALCQLFFWSRALSKDDIVRLLGERFLEAGFAVGLLAPYEPHPGSYRSQAAIYPLFDSSFGTDETPKHFWVAADRLSGTEEERKGRPDDLVFCPLAATGKSFLELMPKDPCGRFLEVCAGCAPAALLAASFAKESVASDLAERCVAFARFVTRLNGTPQVKLIRGASYEGVPGTFDRIAAHPPYMPTLGPAEMYYAGGTTGMDITESLIRGLPAMLNPGGEFFGATMLFEGEECSAEQRVRSWLGDENQSFDVLLFPFYYHSLLEAAQRAAMKAAAGYDGLEKAFNQLAELGFRNAVVCGLLVQRHEAPRRPATARHRIAEGATWRHIRWSSKVESLAAQDFDGSAGLAAIYRVRDSVELLVTHRPSPDGFAAAEFRLKCTKPFAIETKVDAWFTYLLARADGTKTGRDLMHSCIEDKMILPETPPNEFAALLWNFVGGAALDSSACPFPESGIERA